MHSRNVTGARPGDVCVLVALDGADFAFGRFG
jgi:hypothetical protein